MFIFLISSLFFSSFKSSFIHLPISSLDITSWYPHLITSSETLTRYPFLYTPCTEPFLLMTVCSPLFPPSFITTLRQIHLLSNSPSTSLSLSPQQTSFSFISPAWWYPLSLCVQSQCQESHFTLRQCHPSPALTPPEPHLVFHSLLSTSHLTYLLLSKSHSFCISFRLGFSILSV